MYAFIEMYGNISKKFKMFFLRSLTDAANSKNVTSFQICNYDVIVILGDEKLSSIQFVIPFQDNAKWLLIRCFGSAVLLREKEVQREAET